MIDLIYTIINGREKEAAEAAWKTFTTLPSDHVSNIGDINVGYGIYFLCETWQRGDFITYIGLSKSSIRTRIQSHLRDNEKDFSTYRILDLNNYQNKIDLESLESKLINLFAPPANKTIWWDQNVSSYIPKEYAGQKQELSPQQKAQEEFFDKQIESMIPYGLDNLQSIEDCQNPMDFLIYQEIQLRKLLSGNISLDEYSSF